MPIIAAENTMSRAQKHFFMIFILIVGYGRYCQILNKKRYWRADGNVNAMAGCSIDVSLCGGCYAALRIGHQDRRTFIGVDQLTKIAGWEEGLSPLRRMIENASREKGAGINPSPETRPRNPRASFN